MIVRITACMSFSFNPISIPLWDDCEKRLATGIRARAWISIPLWDDCESWAAGAAAATPEFQFHYGMIVRLSSMGSVKPLPISIPLWDDCEAIRFASLTPSSDFNSTMGWLWVSTSCSISKISWISIPLWDDCEVGRNLYGNHLEVFQFHYGMIVSRKIIKKKYWFTACSIN